MAGKLTIISKYSTFFGHLPEHALTDFLIFIQECALGEGTQKYRWPRARKDHGLPLVALTMVTVSHLFLFFFLFTKARFCQNIHFISVNASRADYKGVHRIFSKIYDGDFWQKKIFWLNAYKLLTISQKSFIIGA